MNKTNTQLQTRKVLTLAIAQALMCSASAISAATITVDTNLDTAAIDGNCELREAIAAANTDAVVDACTAGSGDDDIVFDNSLSGSTITLGGTELSIDSNISINGDIDSNDTADITIDGDASSGVIKIGASGTTAILNGLVVQNGYAARGAGVRSSSLSSNLTISNSIITGNTADASDGGGVDSSYGNLTVTDSIISNNTSNHGGGGLYIYNSTVNISASTISGNTAHSEGGGLYINEADITISNSTLSGNSTSLDKGGAVYGYSADTTISNSTISGNNALTGSALYFYYGDISINNSTIVSNTSDSIASTFSAIRLDRLNTISIVNTVLANNDNDDCTGFTVTSESNNLIEDGGSGCGITPVSTADPELGDLADNGGSTFTHLPASTSPVIDAGDNTNCGAGLTIDTDQRGEARDDGSCDIGAVEGFLSTREPAVIAFETGSYDISENGTSITINLTRSGDTDSAVSVDYTTVDGTATSPGDYSSATETISFASGITEQSFSIDITDDEDAESDESFSIDLSNIQLTSSVGNVSLGSTASTTVTITDDDTEDENEDDSSSSSGGATSPWLLFMPIILWLRRKLKQ